MNMRQFGLFFILLILLSSQMVVETEGRKCESKNRWIYGNCVSDEKCNSDCHEKGFLIGKCRGFRNRCFCRHHCLHT
ncbi:unnamed protein product [Lathyrus oleraceus]